MSNGHPYPIVACDFHHATFIYPTSLLLTITYQTACVCCVCVFHQASSPVNPNALDRTAAWLLNMNVQYLDHEGVDPDTKHREDLRNKEELTQTEKVMSSIL